jgi:sorting nexin-29
VYELTHSIATKQGLKQGDGLAPLLFNLALEFILRRLSIDLEGTIKYKSTQILAYADDTAIISWSLSEVTEIYNKLAIAAKEMGSEIKKNKTKLLIQSQRADKQIHSITLMREMIEAVKDFVYLGPNLSANAGEENEIQRRTGQANRVYFTLLPIMRSRVIQWQTKIRLYKTVIRPILWYASESWTLAKKSELALDTFERKVLRRILGPMKENDAWRITYNNELYKQF